jgi:hypothetical protein
MAVNVVCGRASTAIRVEIGFPVNRQTRLCSTVDVRNNGALRRARYGMEARVAEYRETQCVWVDWSTEDLQNV